MFFLFYVSTVCGLLCKQVLPTRYGQVYAVGCRDTYHTIHYDNVYNNGNSFPHTLLPPSPLLPSNISGACVFMDIFFLSDEKIL